MALSKQSLTNQTVYQLHQMIAEGGIKPGEAFATEAELEQRFKVSRPILREAVSHLRALGILESRQRKGLLVSQPDPVGLFERSFENWLIDSLQSKELAEFRYSLEVGAVELAIMGATGDQLDTLARRAEEFARIVREVGSEGYERIDWVELEFHRTILAATKNSMLMRMHHVLVAYFLRASRENPDWNLKGTLERSAWEHQVIAEAFQDRNTERARALLSTHLSRLIRNKPVTA